jgi:hypothetical protein
MRQVIILCGIAIGLAVAPCAHAQTPPPRIVGNQITGNLKPESGGRVVTDTATLIFTPESGAVYTIEFIARHPPLQPVGAPGIVDIVVTEHPREDDTPQMELRVDGETVPLITRLHSSRSVVASVPLADVERLVNAGVVVDRTFGTELELGAGPIRMLRTVLARWGGGSR